MRANDGVSVDFEVVVGQVDVAAIGVAVCQLRRVDRQRSVAVQHEASSCSAVVDMVTPDVTSFGVLLAVRWHTTHRYAVVLSHVPHCNTASSSGIVADFCMICVAQSCSG